MSKYLCDINEKDNNANLPAYAASNTAFIAPISIALLLPIGSAYQLTPKKNIWHAQLITVIPSFRYLNIKAASWASGVASVA